MLADSFLMPHVMQFRFHSYGGTVSRLRHHQQFLLYGAAILFYEDDGSYFNEDHGQRATPAQLWTQADGEFSRPDGISSAEVKTAPSSGMEWIISTSTISSGEDGLISYDWTAPNPTAPIRLRNDAPLGDATPRCSSLLCQAR